MLSLVHVVVFMYPLVSNILIQTVTDSYILLFLLYVFVSLRHVTSKYGHFLTVKL